MVADSLTGFFGRGMIVAAAYHVARVRPARGVSQSGPYKYFAWRDAVSMARERDRQVRCYNADIRSGRRGLSERYPDKTIIGVTGNIAMGKSLVLGMLAERGAAVIDADQAAHQVLRRGGAAYEPVLATFGSAILGADGEIQRSALGDIVFADPAQLQRLEAITHPAIRLEIDRRIRSAAADVVVIEAIKLLEGDLKNALDAVWVVDASPGTQLERLMNVRGMSQAEARRRINGQNSQVDKLKQADLILSNDGDCEHLRAQVQRAWRRISTRQSNQP